MNRWYVSDAEGAWKNLTSSQNKFNKPAADFSDAFLCARERLQCFLPSLLQLTTALEPKNFHLLALSRHHESILSSFP